MIIIDASVALHILASPELEPEVTTTIEGFEVLNAPSIIDVELLSGLRRLVAHKSLAPGRALQILEDLRRWPLDRHHTDRLLDRIWSLRHNVTPYDAAYIALSEAMNLPLYTRDKRLTSAPGHSAEIRLI